METADPDIQKVNIAIYESLRPGVSPFATSRNGSWGTGHRKEFLRQLLDVHIHPPPTSGLLSVHGHQMLTFRVYRFHRSGSIVRQNSKKSEKGEEPMAIQDPSIRDVIEKEIILASPEKGSVKFDDIAGLHVAKKLLTEAVSLPLLMPDFFTGIREPWKGVLLFGPPGTGKTLLAKALASTGSIRFFNCPSSSLTSKYRGDSEKLMKAVFSMARKSAPSIVFFDEADALISKRGTSDEHEASRRFKSEVLQQMDGVMGNAMHVMVLATSNCPWDIDEAILRRFEKRIYVPLPDQSARKAAIQLHLKEVRCSDDVDVDTVARLLEGHSGADIRLVCKDACMMFMRKWIEGKSPEEILAFKDDGQENAIVTMDDFRRAIEKSTPSVRNAERYEKWAADYGCV